MEGAVLHGVHERLWGHGPVKRGRGRGSGDRKGGLHLVRRPLQLGQRLARIVRDAPSKRTLQRGTCGTSAEC